MGNLSTGVGNTAIILREKQLYLNKGTFLVTLDQDQNF